MSKQIEIKGFIIARPDSIELSSMFSKECESMLDFGYVAICPHIIEFTVPDEFNPIAAKVSALEAQREAITLKFYERVEHINDEIKKLSCLEFSPSDAS